VKFQKEENVIHAPFIQDSMYFSFTYNLEIISQEEGLFSLNNYLRSCDNSLANWQAQRDAHGLGE
jgi:predicted HicB family RNase H-like nuclease